MALKGEKLSNEVKKKISDTKKMKYASGEIVPWNKDKKILAICGDNNPSKRLDVRLKISKSLLSRYKRVAHHKKGVPHTVEHSNKISLALRKRYSVVEHHRKGCIFTDEHKNNISKSLKELYNRNEHHNKGISLSLETKRKMSDARKQYYLNSINREKNRIHLNEIRQDMNGIKNPFYHKHHSMETKNRLSENHKGLLIGERNGNWNNGSSFFPYGSDFRESLKEFVRNSFGRDCVMCFEPENGQMMDVHHIDKDKNNNILENLLPVHHGICHRKAEDYLCIRSL